MLHQNEMELSGSGGTAHPAAAPPKAYRAFFCRLDDALDERKIPLRMRVGDLATVNRLERKPGW